MRNKQSRSAILTGFASAVTAFGAAAMMSTATVPTAHADGIVDTINVEYEIGQANFAAASVDFGSGDLVPGLTAFFDGSDDVLLGPSQTVLVGTVEALTGETLANDLFTFGVPEPTDLSDAVSLAQGEFNFAATEFGNAALAFSGGDYGAATSYELFAVDFSSIIPVEELLLGAAASLTLPSM